MNWTGNNGILKNCNFINNTGVSGGSIFWNGFNGTLTDCTFLGNTATYASTINWWGTNGRITGCTFTKNVARGDGCAINWASATGSITDSIFTDNTAGVNGGAINWQNTGLIINCTFNSKYTKSNGIYARKNLTVNDGKGIVDIVTQGTLSGISTIVLNNETYYYPPNTNINFVNNVLNYA